MYRRQNHGRIKRVFFFFWQNATVLCCAVQLPGAVVTASKLYNVQTVQTGSGPAKIAALLNAEADAEVDRQTS
jgi:hypothetical protein